MSAGWANLTDLQVNATGIAVYPPLATLGPRLMQDNEFVWIIEGDVGAQLDDQRIEASPGTVLLSRMGMTDRYDWDTQHRTVHAFFHFSYATARGWPPVNEWPLFRELSDGDVIRPLFRYILNTHPLAEPVRSTLLMPAVELLLRSFISGRVATAAEPPVALPRPVERSLEMIRDVVYQTKPNKLRLADLAIAAHVTPEHLCRLFRKHLELGPLECLRLARLQFAATLLSRSNMSVKEVADASGFASPYHFSRTFQQTYGVPPRDYREALFTGQKLRVNPIVRSLPLKP